jgi:DNA-binding CsgD family transcriptional regulator
MKSVEQRLQVLIDKIQRLQGEIDCLKRSGCRQLWMYANAGIKVQMCPAHTLLGANFAEPSQSELDGNIPKYCSNTEVAMLKPGSNHEELLNIASMGKNAEYISEPLTSRETQILEGIASGNTNKEIAHMLGISEQTVKSHVSAILRKLKANDRAHAVFLGMRDGWLSMEIEPKDMVAVS